ncbi:hypothetical protein Nepgr_021565 [Nepenthes gracilis]|uniref:Uncharacterized protein n=1 Tax=Nepenthes gracilis TaxID=150966 RepID=A0AAD3XX56_NEPGR|nr:hypothetical protein Nepgr_021565 [Nepenthes gracilis]
MLSFNSWPFLSSSSTAIKQSCNIIVKKGTAGTFVSGAIVGLQNSSFEAEKMQMRVVMMMRGLLLSINHTLNVAKFFHVAGDGDWSFVIESILFLCFLHQLLEQRMVDVYDRDDKPLQFLFSFMPHHDRQAAFWGKRRGMREEMASLNRVREDSVKELLTLFMIS